MKRRKHNQLESLEKRWIFDYLKKKYDAGVNITMHKRKDNIERCMEQLLFDRDLRHIDFWVENHMDPSLKKSLNGAIRAKRKRYHDNETATQRKKSIDLDFFAWKLLAEFAEKKELSLSAAIEYLVALDSNPPLK